jgi:hypothetical protein
MLQRQQLASGQFFEHTGKVRAYVANQGANPTIFEFTAATPAL